MIIDLKRVRLFAELNRLAYNPKNIAEPEYNKLGFSLVEFIDILGIQIYILKNELELIFVFRGSDERNDFFADINIELTKFEQISPIVKVHRGFYYSYTKISQYISYYKDINKDKDIYYTGHSYGGALALLSSSFYKPNAVITFGSPMVGNSYFKQFLNHNGVNHIRVRNNMDIVTKLPSRLLGYRHQGTLLYLDYYGNKIINPTRWQLFKDMVRSRLKAWSKKQLFDGYYDHYMEEYIEKLEK